MHFLSDFEAISQDILEKVGKEMTSEYGKKGAKSNCYEYWDRFKRCILKSSACEAIK